MLIGEKSVVNCWSVIISLGYCGLWELEEMSPGEGWMSSAVGFTIFL